MDKEGAIYAYIADLERGSLGTGMRNMWQATLITKGEDKIGTRVKGTRDEAGAANGMNEKSGAVDDATVIIHIRRKADNARKSVVEKKVDHKPALILQDICKIYTDFRRKLRALASDKN